jgi:transposase
MRVAIIYAAAGWVAVEASDTIRHHRPAPVASGLDQYPGQKIPIIDRTTGEILLEAEIFVAVLGASNYTYAQACRSQDLTEWVSAHTRML